MGRTRFRLMRTRTGRGGVQRGSVLTETALLLSLVLLMALGLLALARTAWTAHAAVDAAAAAARLAGLCGHGTTQAAVIRERLRPQLEASGQLQLAARHDWLVLQAWPLGCDSRSCTHVHARLQGLHVAWGAGPLQGTVDLSPAMATATREAWGQLGTGTGLCAAP